MILKTASGKTYMISSDSNEFVFVRRFSLEEATKASELIFELTDDELSTYTLSDLNGDRTFHNGHFAYMQMEPEGKRYIAKYYIAERKEE